MSANRAASLSLVAVAAGLAATAVVARGDQPGHPERPPPDGVAAFREVARVLQSPRCRNCHPAGDRPLQTDAGRPHRMNISRASIAAGLPCSTCHQERNAERLGVVGGPPGAPHWGLPPADTPMVFEGRTPHALCLQLRDPSQTGGRDLDALLEHVSRDPLVLWAWQPGGKRTPPPVPHDRFAAAFRTWVEAGGPCPPAPPPPPP